MQVKTQAAQLSAAAVEGAFAAAVHARREAKLLDTAQKFEQLYRCELDRLQRLYLHDMGVRLHLQLASHACTSLTCSMCRAKRCMMAFRCLKQHPANALVWV